MRKVSNIFWGVFLLICGALLIVGQFFSFRFIPTWVFTVTILLIAAIVQCIAGRRYWHALVPLAIIYMMLQKYLNIFYISPRILILSSVLLSVGLGIIFKPRPTTPPCQTYANVSYSTGRNADIPYTTVSDNSPTENVTFSGASKYLKGQEIVDGQFYVSFGGLDLHLEQANLHPNGATFFLDCSFGAIKLYVPRHWRINDKVATAFGAVDSNARYAAPDASSPILTLTGNVNFGAVEIKYV